MWALEYCGSVLILALARIGWLQTLGGFQERLRPCGQLFLVDRF